ncbi:MAG: PEGA domain-containing protein [Myxococcota bacterium]
MWLLGLATAGTLELHVAPADAAVAVDGEPRGVGPMTVSLPDGAHRVRVTRETFEPWEAVVEVRPAGVCVAVTLARSPVPWDAEAARGKQAREEIVTELARQTVDPTGIRTQPRDENPPFRDAPPPPKPPDTAGPPPWEVAEPCPTGSPAAPPPPPAPP